MVLEDYSYAEWHKKRGDEERRDVNIGCCYEGGNKVN